MKKLLLSAILVLGSFSAFAQDDCSTPIEITDNGTVTAPEVTGIFESACYNITTAEDGSELYGLWYSFTPLSDGEVTINSNIVQATGNSNDTMVQIYTGTCGALDCVTANDDVSGTNFLSNVSFPVAAGVTYYIEWSNYWNGAAFDFDFTYTEISCLKTYAVNVPTNTTTTGVTLNWEASLSNPANYEVEYGPVGFAQGTGTTENPTTNTLVLSGLTADTVYDYYIRSNCGATQSVWTPVSKFTTAKLCPEAFGFESDSQLAGWTTAGNGAYGPSVSAPANAHTGNFYYILNNSTTVSNNFLFTPAFSLAAGEQVTASFWLRNTTSRRLRLTVGNAPTAAAQTTVIYNNAALINANYTQITAPVFTAPAAGIYYFAFNDYSLAAATAATMRLDDVSFTSVLGTNDFLSSKFSVYPNPVNNVINFSNDANAVVSTVEMADLNGRVIKSEKVNATEGQISVSDLATGMYMMKITTDQGVAVKKIVKQ